MFEQKDDPPTQLMRMATPGPLITSPSQSKGGVTIKYLQSDKAPIRQGGS